MAIIVDKNKKRKDIAVACTELLLEKGIKKLTVSEIAQTAGIGKGTVYDYFENKDGVVFEIIRNLMIEHQNTVSYRIDENTTCKQKVFYLFDFLLCDFKDYSKHLEVYKEYMSVTLACNSQPMLTFNSECHNFFESLLSEIITQGINKGEIKAISVQFISGIMASERGFMLSSWIEDKDMTLEFKSYLNSLFNFLEIKK